jgi:hypothetical protein
MDGGVFKAVREVQQEDQERPKGKCKDREAPATMDEQRSAGRCPEKVSTLPAAWLNV